MTLSWWPCHKIVSVTFTFTSTKPCLHLKSILTISWARWNFVEFSVGILRLDIVRFQSLIRSSRTPSVRSSSSLLTSPGGSTWTLWLPELPWRVVLACWLFVLSGNVICVSVELLPHAWHCCEPQPKTTGDSFPQNRESFFCYFVLVSRALELCYDDAEFQAPHSRWLDLAEIPNSVEVALPEWFV